MQLVRFGRAIALFIFHIHNVCVCASALYEYDNSILTRQFYCSHKISI